MEPSPSIVCGRTCKASPSGWSRGHWLSGWEGVAQGVQTDPPGRGGRRREEAEVGSGRERCRGGVPCYLQHT